MKKMIFTLIFMGLILNVYSQRPSNQDDIDHAGIIVKFKSDLDINFKESSIEELFSHEKLQNIGERFQPQSIEVTGDILKNNMFALEFDSSRNVKTLVKKYSKTNLFEYVEPNYIIRFDLIEDDVKPNINPYGKSSNSSCQSPWGCFTPNDPEFNDQWALQKIQMPEAWEIDKGDRSVTVAIIDSGLNYMDNDILFRNWFNTPEWYSGNNGIDSDNNGYVDDAYGWDFSNDDRIPEDSYGSHGHGTGVASVIGARLNNNDGIAGMDKNCKIMPLKAGTYSNIVSAIYYAVNEEVEVINMSFGANYNSNILKQALNNAYNAGVVLVAGSGNDGNSAPFYPASYKNVISVGATNEYDNRAGISNYGNDLDVVAPGISIKTYNKHNWPVRFSGTSLSAPHVSGLAALILSRFKDENLSPQDVRSIIRFTAEDQVGDPSEDTPGYDDFYGYGRINAFKALWYGDLIADFYPNGYGKNLNKSLVNEKINKRINDMKEAEVDFKVNVFPNPVLNQLKIQANANIEAIQIHSIDGAKVLHKRNIKNPNDVNLNVSNFQTGIYLVSILGENNQIIATKKISKK